MPQATDELRKRWGGENGVGDDKAMNHLLFHGFTFHQGIIHPPKGWDWKDPTAIGMDTWGAVEFLCDEWDYGYEPDKS